MFSFKRRPHQFVVAQFSFSFRLEYVWKRFFLIFLSLYKNLFEFVIRRISRLEKSSFILNLA